MARLIDRRQVVGVCGGTTWPAVTPEVKDLGWKLRYAPGELNHCEFLILASIVEAYIIMVKAPQKRRNAVCREIVAASQTPLGDGKGRTV